MTAKPFRGVCLASAMIAALAIWSESSRAQTALSGQTDLARLVDLASQKLGIRITYDDQSLKGKVTVRQDQSLSDVELWQFTNRVLAEQGFTTIRAGDDASLSVTKIATAAQMAKAEPLEDVQNSRGPQPGFRRVIVPVKHASSKDLVAAIQLVQSKPAGVVAESEQTGLIVVADLAPYLNIALRLVEQLDGDGGVTVEEVPAKNVDAGKLATQVKQLADKRKAVGGRDLRGDVIASASGTSVLVIAPVPAVAAWRELVASIDQRERVERRSYQPASFGLKDVAGLIEQTVKVGSSGSGASDDRWRVVQDDLTGSLIITATPVQHEQITELMQRLASIPAAARRPVKTFKIRNRGVKEVQQVIEDLLRAGVLEAQATGDSAVGNAAGSSTTTIAAAGSQTSPRPVEPGGVAVPTNPAPAGPTFAGAAPGSLLALPTRGQRASSSVTVSTPLTLTSDEATNTLIAVGEPRLISQLETLLPTLDVRQPQVMLEAILVSLSDSESRNFGVELEQLRVSGDTVIRLSSLFGLSTAAAGVDGRTRAVGDSAGFTGTVLNPGDFSVVVRALESMNHGRSMSMPKVLVNNNQQATFNSVLQQPFATTNASTTVATTAFGGTQDAGTTISVKPQIAEGDHLVLTYSVALSSFVGAAASANVPPPRQQNTVQSVATIPDGYTVVVGGLELNTDGNDVTQVPFIGDIPVIGELFKNRSRNHGRQRFYVFLRASVLRQSNLEDLKYLSDVEATAASVPDGWPIVEPRIIR